MGACFTTTFSMTRGSSICSSESFLAATESNAPEKRLVAGGTIPKLCPTICMRQLLWPGGNGVFDTLTEQPELKEGKLPLEFSFGPTVPLSVVL